MFSERDKVTSIVKHALRIEPGKIIPMKEGMTNDSYLVETKIGKFVVRLNGNGTSKLIARSAEKEIYKAIMPLGICDPVVAIDTVTEGGYKISRYLDHSRVCNPENWEDVRKVMDFLREVHSCKQIVNHQFNIYEAIVHYENLRNGEPSKYEDYEVVRNKIFSYKKRLNTLPRYIGLSHIDSVYSNFLICGNEIRLIDWEYAAMCDQDVDIAMFAIYANYGVEEAYHLMSLYMHNDKVPAERFEKILIYMATGGLLWSNWCEYKEKQGEHFKGYDLNQYRYAQSIPFYIDAIRSRE